MLAVPSDNQELFRPGCTSSALYEFSCPASSPHEHTRHAHPENCDQFYLCIAGRARRQSCSPGLVFNPVSLSCEGQETVEGPCSRFYNSTFLPKAIALGKSIQAGDDSCMDDSLWS